MAVHIELYCQVRKTKIKTESKVPHFEQVFEIDVPFTSSCSVGKDLGQPACPTQDSAYTNDDPNLQSHPRTRRPSAQPLCV